VRSALRAAERFEAAAVELRRARAEVGAERSRELALREMALATFDRFLRLVVEGLRGARWAALVCEPPDDDGPPQAADRDVDDVADMKLACRLHARVVDVHLAARDSLGREAARLEEPAGPEPLVDAHLVHGSIVAWQAALVIRPTGLSRWVAAIAAVQLTVLVATSTRYGYHRD